MSDDYRVPVPYELRREKLEAIAKRIKRDLPEGWGFGLLLFDYAKEGDSGSMVWISSANREDMLKAMQEFLRKQAS